jgi:hypothetical protein
VQRHFGPHRRVGALKPSDVDLVLDEDPDERRRCPRLVAEASPEMGVATAEIDEHLGDR